MEAILKKRTIPIQSHQDTDSTKAVQLFFCGGWVLLRGVAAFLRRSLLHLRRNKRSKLAPKIEELAKAFDRGFAKAFDRGFAKAFDRGVDYRCGLLLRGLVRNPPVVCVEM